MADSLGTAPEDISGLTKYAPDNYAIHSSNEKSQITHAFDNDTNEVEEGIIRPTEEERLTLRRVSGSIPWVAYSLCAVEFAERASYYGCSDVFSNFIQFPLP